MSATDFDVFHCDLGGINLIEASAGTGKTWTICGIYLRLLLERRLPVQSILVVTFTHAATAELRSRIRARIAEALAYLRNPGGATPAADRFVATLVDAVQRRTAAPSTELAAALDVALQFFDEAAIHTIHGFCQRALADAAFAAGLPFAPELAADDRELTLEAVNDFWRRRIAADCPPELALHLVARRDSPEKYARLLARSIAKPLARSVWPAEIDAPARIDATASTAAFATARATWAAQRDRIVAAVHAASPGLYANWYDEARIDQAARGWDAWFASDDALARFDDDCKLQLFAAGTLDAKVKRGAKPPAHRFFAEAEALLAARAALDARLELARMRLIRELIETVGAELRRRKRERRLVAFNDMLYNVHAALAGSDGASFAEALRGRFPVALIDEFQDTDPLQFAIFERIYGQGGAPAFFVGDPKQAIYSFRNADLNAYLRARSGATATYTLARNQRSTRGLIDALNGLYTATAHPFLLGGLDYHRVGMGEKPRSPLCDRTLARADLQLWMLPESGTGTPIAKVDARSLSARATAREIARLIGEGQRGRITIGERPLAPADIAVLVRTHAQGSEVKRELARLDIGSVELAQESVFHSTDAEEVERVLLAINEPAREGLLRAALATEVMGFDAAALLTVAADEAAFAAYVERFAAYREVWLRQGVGVMYRRFLSDYHVSARMLVRADGERRLTNLLHLGEQIHAAAATHASPDALLRWLQTRRRDAAIDDVAQLRLESDRNLVQIVTIYKAKGLEFPIVFCPFLWDGRIRLGPPPPQGREYHDADGTAVIDFRSDDEMGGDAEPIKARVRLEEAAEVVRLAYVALTRAIYRCYVIIGCYTMRTANGTTAAESTKSVLNWLACGGEATWDAWCRRNRSPAAIDAAWRSLAARLAPQASLDALPEGRLNAMPLHRPSPAALSALPAPPPIMSGWRIGSFSALIGAARSEAAAHDRDAHVADAKPIGSPPPDLANDDILRFPRGPRAGECLHAIFERIDFRDDAGWGIAIERALAAYPQLVPGVRASEQPALLARIARVMLGDVLAAKLPDGIVLAEIPKARCLAELEFNLPSSGITASGLNSALAALGYRVPRLAFRDIEGYLKGVIDLVFEHRGRYYIVDWKSNHLGYARDDYAPAALASAMADHSYHLQYLIYALALDRYLRTRIDGYRHDAHFGGVLYLFVRGMRARWNDGSGAPCGVFHHRPTASTLARLDAVFGALRDGAAP